MKKIAVPIKKNNYIAGHFGHCEFYEIYTFSNANEVIDVQLLKSEKGCGCQSNIATVLASQGVSFMLSGNIGDKAMHKLNDAGISVIRGCKGSSSDVILQYVEGRITDAGSSCQLHSHKVDTNHECQH